MSYQNIVTNLAAAERSDLRKNIIQSKNQKAPTMMSLKEGNGGVEKGHLAGLDIPFWNGVHHGDTALDVLGGVTSFEFMINPKTAKMYVGLPQTGFTVQLEHFHNKDAEAGRAPLTQSELRQAVLNTYNQHQNWYCIGKGDGALGVITVGGGSGTITMAADNTAWGRSKGSLRLAVSPGTVAGDRIEYESYTKSTDTKTATFYVTSKPNATQAVIVAISGTTVAGDIVVKKGHYKKVMNGIGDLVDYTNRTLQAVSTASYPFLNAQRVQAAGALTPTVIDTAKLGVETVANDNGARKKRIMQLTHGHYSGLKNFGYNLRQYNAEKGGANKTFGHPEFYEDEDTIFARDANWEDGFAVMRDQESFFIYRQSEMEQIWGNSAHQYIGTNSVGSTEAYANYGEAKNLAWDMRGDDGKKAVQGRSNTNVIIDGITIPAVNQVSIGQSLV